MHKQARCCFVLQDLDTAFSLPSKATIWRVQIEGGQPEQLTETNSFTPCPSPDGSRIEFFPTGPGFSIMRSEGGEPIKTLSFQNLPVTYAIPPQWTPDGRALTFGA